MIASAREFLRGVQEAFELLERPSDSLIQFPITFRNGDYVPIHLSSDGTSWQLSDNSDLYGSLWPYTRKDFFRGRLGDRVRAAVEPRGLVVREETGQFVRPVAEGESPAVAFADFVQGLLEIERIVLDAEARRPSRWARTRDEGR